VVGVAEYFRAFPPEDALASVCVDAEFRQRGIGTALFESVISAAARDGKRNLCGFIADDDVAMWKLLRSAGVRVRTYEVDRGLYVEVDTASRRRY